MSGYITSVGISCPPYRFRQGALAEFMAESAGMNPQEKQRLMALYRTSGIKYRHSVLADFGKQYRFFSQSSEKQCQPDVSDRMKVYRQYAPLLSVQAIKECLHEHENINEKDITHLITVSCTGMYAPGLDIDIVRELGLSFSVQRTSVNFMGCYAAFNGLKLASSIVAANPEANVMVVCVELCTLHYLPGTEEEQMLANALFADGAAAALVQSHADGQPALEIQSSFCDLLPDGSGDMSWEIQNQAFAMRLSAYVPELLRKGVGKLSALMVNKLSCHIKEIGLFAIHPGGKRILEVTEEEFGIDRNDNRYAWEVMRNYGNMSSATILFILHRILQEQQDCSSPQKILAMAFGPGLTLESMVMNFVPNYNSNINHKKGKLHGYIQSKV
ncbi:type III polyketide synthase [Cytophagaceae bacterium ABcell3]|nr:type III polyketide synthase [Cytophagaceae bacterium ABcell3]